jgi:hypothetical protein
MRRGASLLRPRTALLFSVLAICLVVVPAAGSAAETVTITPTIEGIAGANGWYRGNDGGNYVVLHWTVSGPVTATTNCEAAIRINGPTPGTRRTCTAETVDGGTVSSTTKLIKIDADPPTGVGATAARPPDTNGWYNHALAIGWQGSDATSGIAGCSSVTYAGPDGASAAVSGGCSDNAGNSAATTLSLRYDATAPTLTGVAVQSNSDADVVNWKSSSPADTAVVTRVARGSRQERLVFRGAAERFVDKTIRDGVEYRYSVRTSDQAGNGSNPVSVVGLPKVVTLGKPTYVPRAAAEPILRWSGVRGATYYHVQLYRRGKRILAAWPRTPELALRTTWVWGGRRYRLTPGRYRWYAWAGFGRRSAANYKLLGKDVFVATRSG